MEWPQIVTTITEGNAISTVVDAPWVSVTSVNGMSGDVITEPIMENFQTNHYYPKNTIINYNGMIYWAKNTFTSGANFDADDWYTLDITSSKVLTGQLQKTSYRRSVIALCEVSTADNTSLNSYTSGRLAFHRYNGLSGSVEINVQAENRYSTAYYFNFDYYSNLNLLDGTANIETAAGFRPCTFKYNNVWYGGIEVFIGNAEFNNITFDGAGNFEIFGLDYYSVVHGTTAASILNQEVYDSLDYTKWNLMRSDFYADAFYANSGKLKKSGGYVATLPDKTGTLAMTSDIPSVNDATLTIQKNGSNVATFTSNASSNVTANIVVPTQTSQLTNNSGFITSSSLPTKLTDLTNDDNFLRGVTSQSITALSSFVTTGMIADSAITTVKINDSAVTAAKIDDDAVTTAKIYDGSVTNAKIADGVISSSKIDYSTFGATWSGYYFTLPAESQDIVVTTKKGTQLTLRVSNGGTCIRVVAGGEDIKLVRQYWEASYSSALTDNYGLHGCKSGATISSRYINWLNNGSSSNGGVIATTASTGTDGDCYGSLASISNSKVTTVSNSVLNSVGNNGWEIIGDFGETGSGGTMYHHNTVVTSGTGYVPATYQRGATLSNVTSGFNYIEIVEG